MAVGQEAALMSDQATKIVDLVWEKVSNWAPKSNQEIYIYNYLSHVALTLPGPMWIFDGTSKR